MAFALYIVLEPRECDDKGLDVQRLAFFLHRTPSAVALKIWNIAAYDANRKAHGRVGMQHGSKLDAQVWQWHKETPDTFMEECLDLLQNALWEANRVNFSPTPLASDRHSSLAHTPASQPILLPQLADAELSAHLLYNRHTDSHTADRQPHQTMESFDTHRENRRFEWITTQRLPRPSVRPRSYLHR